MSLHPFAAGIQRTINRSEDFGSLNLQDKRAFRPSNHALSEERLGDVQGLEEVEMKVARDAILQDHLRCAMIQRIGKSLDSAESAQPCSLS